MQHMGYGTTEGGGFVLGGQLCRRDAHGCVAFAPASLDRTAASMAHLLKPAGTLDNWKRAANLYARPGEEPMAFVVLTGFAAPLLHFTDTSGLLVHLCGESGTGKSTVMATTAAIWGNPKALVQHAPTSKYGSTHNALMAELGVLHNLPLMFDELPLTRPEGVFRLLHALVSGYERNRMSPSLDLKPGRTWQSVYLSAARCPLRTLAAGFSDGEHAAVFERTIEIALPRIDPRDRRWIAERAAAELALTNYGHAGQVFTQWLVANYDRLPKLIDTKREELMLRVGARRDEWCLFSGFAAVLVAAEMAKAAGLHDIDVEALGQWVIDTLLPAQRQGGGGKPA